MLANLRQYFPSQNVCCNQNYWLCHPAGAEENLWINVKKGKSLHKKTTCSTKIRFSSRFQAKNWDGMVTSKTTAIPISECAVDGQSEAQSSCSGLTQEFRHTPGMAVWEHRQTRKHCQDFSGNKQPVPAEEPSHTQTPWDPSYRHCFPVFFTGEPSGMLGVTHLPRLFPLGFSHRFPVCKSL